MFVKGSLGFDLNGVKCTRKVEKNLRKVLSCRQNPQTGCVKKCKKTGIFELFWPLMSI